MKKYLKKYLIILLIILSFNLNSARYNIINYSDYTITINSDRTPVTAFAKTILAKQNVCGTNTTIQAEGQTAPTSKITISLNCVDTRVGDLTINNDGKGGITAVVTFENRPQAKETKPKEKPEQEEKPEEKIKPEENAHKEVTPAS